MRQKKKLILLSSLAGVSTLALVSLSVFGKDNAFNFGKVNADLTYQLAYDADHRVVDAQIKTNFGNTIWTKANFNASFTENGIEFTKYGYIQNLSPINGIKSLDIDVTSGKYVVCYAYGEPSDLQDREYYKTTISGDSVVSFDGIKAPTHFRVQAIEAGTIASLKVNYSCAAGEADPNAETAAEGLENLKSLDSYNKGVAYYTVDANELCQSEYAVSKRALKITNATVNESIGIFNKALADSAGLTFGSDDNYLIFDVKSNGPKIGHTNPFMFSTSLKSNAYSSGWQDPDGFFELPDNPGWYRYWWKIDSNEKATYPNTIIPMDQINSINLVASQTQSADTYYILDNIHIGQEPRKQFTNADNRDIPTANQFTVTQKTVFSFDFKVTDEIDASKRFYFGYGNWSQYFDFDINADGTRHDNNNFYTGTSAEALSNGWYRMTVDASKMNRVSGAWKTWDFDGNNAMSVILKRQWNTYNGISTSPRLVSDN